VSYNSPLIAPISEGQEVGKIAVSVRQRTIEIPVLAAQAVAEKGFVGKFFEKVSILIFGAGVDEPIHE
jgi:D-alanyl-D-alanine carboxypeptidase